MTEFHAFLLVEMILRQEPRLLKLFIWQLYLYLSGWPYVTVETVPTDRIDRTTDRIDRTGDCAWPYALTVWDRIWGRFWGDRTHWPYGPDCIDRRLCVIQALVDFLLVVPAPLYLLAVTGKASRLFEMTYKLAIILSSSLVRNKQNFSCVIT